MKQALKNSIKENMHGILECTFVHYANCLRASYPDKTIRNAAVFASDVPEFARLGYIELVDVRSNIPDGLPPGLVRTIKRAKHQPIWIPGPNFPDDPWDMYEQMKPSIRGTRWFGSIFRQSATTRGVTQSGDDCHWRSAFVWT